MNASTDTADIARQRARLAEIEANLARLRARYDVLMNAFKFDDAGALAPTIEAAQREQAALAAAVPAQPSAEPAPYVVARRRRRRR